MEIVQATLDDFEGIVALLRRYHVDYISPEDKKDGFVTTNLTTDQLTRLIVDEQGVTIAKENGRVYAFALAASWDYWAEWPLFAYMIEHLEEYELDGVKLTRNNSYQYGPICVDTAVVVQVYLRRFSMHRWQVCVAATLLWLHLSIR